MVSVGSSNLPAKKMAPAWGAEAKLGLLLLGSLASQAATHNDSVIHTCPQVYLIQNAHKSRNSVGSPRVEAFLTVQEERTRQALIVREAAHENPPATGHAGIAELHAALTADVSLAFNPRMHDE